MTDFIVILNDGTTAPVLNDGNTLILLNQTQEAQPHGVWEGPLQKPQIIKPWKDKKQELEESSLDLLIISEPTMGQLFKTDLSLLPYLKQYEDQLYDILLKPIKGTFDEWKIRNGSYLKKPFLNAEIKMKYESPQITFRPIREQIFKKTLYGEKLHGIRIIEMVKELLGISQGDLAIRPDITIRPTPENITKGEMLTLSVRLYEHNTGIPMEVSKVYMNIISVDDGHEVWPLEVIRKNTSGFDILIGTSEMKAGHEYLIRISNNPNLSPSGSTQFKIKKTTIIPIIPIIPLIPIPAIKRPTDDIKKKQIEAYVFRTQMDHRVCALICKPLENRVYYPDENKPNIPDDTHPRCRCTYDIIFKDD